MTLETFFEKFDQFADAPGAVKKMRELVLELAVSGRLMPEILERSIENETKPMGSIVELVMGQAPSGDECNAEKRGTVFVKVGEFGLLYPREEVWTTNPLKFAKKGDVLVCVVGATVGKLNLGIDCAIGRSVAAIRPSQALDTQFLYYSLIPYTIRLRRNSRGSAQGVIGKTELNAVSLWVPSRSVQERIVAKVDELMALCDRLEAQQLEREVQAGQLARASLTRFADAPTPANLNLLFHSSFPISPSDLRKSILTLAVQGKLVPQGPNDEPAEELLASLEQERPSIAKEQGVRLPKNVPSLTADNFPHDIPDSWQWSRIGNLALVIDYGTSQKAGDDSLKVPVYRMGNIVGGRLVDENLKYVDSSIDDLPRLYLKTDDILFNRTNSYELVGKAGMFTGRDATATFASYLIRIRLSSTFLFPNFFSIAMNAPYFRQTQIEPEVVQQCGQANFNGTKLASTVVPVPPLAEQRRIVAKVSELMALVDELETQIAASRAAAEKLLSALVAELTGTTSRLPADS
jgi:type I restriction enzyme S subunit